MNVPILLAKLFEIERSIGLQSDMATRRQLMDVQDWVLQTQKDVVDTLRTKPETKQPPIILLYALPPSGAAR